MELKDILRTRSYRNNSHRNDSYIELPDAIDSLIDNKLYRNKFKSLIRKGHLRDLLELAEIALTKDKPSCWYARVTSKKEWERTLEFLSKLREVARKAAEVTKRLSVGTRHMKAIYKACWTAPNVLQHAITAEEIGRDKFKLFCWLYSRKNKIIHESSSLL